MLLNELKPANGSKKERKRIGRGHGTGWGKTAGKGHNGQKQRAGASIGLTFEGGQMPLVRRIPKRGFTNSLFKKVVVEVSLQDIVDVFNDGETVNLHTLIENGLVKNIPFRNKYDFEISEDQDYLTIERKYNVVIKVIGNAEVDKKLKLEVNKVSKGAQELVEKAGGSVELVPIKGYERNSKKSV